MHQHESKTKLLDATLKVVRAKGYSATRIEDVCAEAGLTKGSFFHHFKSKEDLALSAVAHWEARTSAAFATAPYHEAADALSRMIAYIEFRKALLTGDLPDFTCFVGTIVQKTRCPQKPRTGDTTVHNSRNLASRRPVDNFTSQICLAHFWRRRRRSFDRQLRRLARRRSGRDCFKLLSGFDPRQEQNGSLSKPKTTATTN
jgi:AcrR family transcriptional regulator